MEKQENLQKTNMPELDNLEFIMQGEKASVIFLFKSAEDAKQALEGNEEYNTWMSVASIKIFDENILIATISALYNTYEVVALIKNQNNFTEKEICNISLKSPNKIYSEDADRVGIGGMFTPHYISEITSIINYYNVENLLGMEFKSKHDLSTGKYIFYNNMLIKTFDKKNGKYSGSYLKVLTNYSFKILNIFNYNDGAKKQDIELEITDLKGNTSSILLSATDKYSLANFRKNINITGAFLDFMTNEDFNKIMNQLYSEADYKTICKYDRPGLIADKDVYLTANEVIKLEN